MNRNRGITLISLVITIIILLILAGISIAMLTGNNGLLTKANIASEETKKATYKEVLELIGMEIRPEKILENLGTKEFMDRYQEKIEEEIKEGDILKDATQERKSDETIHVTTKEGWVYKITEDKVEFLGKKGENPPPDLQVTDIELETNPTGWTTGNVKVKIIVTNSELKKYSLQYLKNTQSWSNYEGEFEVTENGPIHARLINELDEVGAAATKTISNIDREDPNEAEVTITNNSTDNSVTATVTQSDSKSGVDITKCKWVYTQSNKTLGTEEEKYTGGSFKTNPEDITIKDYIAGTYYLHILTVDNVGNKRETIKEVQITREPVEFSKDYGRIEVIWLDTQDNIIPEPNEPKLGNMTRVKWNGETEVELQNNTGWYNYKAGNGTNDNTSSEWANAKNAINGVDSYFVWIPRYAYRIVYYESETSNKVTGYCDGKGMRGVNGEVQQKISDFAKSVEVNGKSYIVHPAFRNGRSNNFKNGEWDSELSGIWIAKYESCRNDATDKAEGSGNNIKIVPNVISWSGIKVGDCYTKAYNYDRNKESHLMKNSEWGAVAYLAHSQYGRNGTFVGNAGNSYVTGTGGAKASTTGNKSGIFDLAAGRGEFVAGYISNGDASLSTYAGSFAESKMVEDGWKTLSTKYVTVYPFDSLAYSGNPSYELYKEVGYGYGDAVLEVSYQTSSLKTWAEGYANFPYKEKSFFYRGRTGYKTGADRTIVFL